MSKPKKVDEKTKKQALREYRKTGNASAIAKKYGVARSTFLAWLPKVSKVVEFQPNNPTVTKACVHAIERTSDAVIRTIEANAISRQEFIQEHYAELSEALCYNISAITSRLKDNPQGIPFRDLAASLTALTNIVKEFLPVEEQGTTQINLLQQTVNN